MAADVNTPETPDPGQRPAKFDAASGPQGPGAGGAALTLATDLKMCLCLVLVLHGNGEPIENTGGLNL